MTLIRQLRALLFVCLLCASFLICFGREPAASGHNGSTQTKSTVAQGKRQAKKTQKPQAKPPTELDKLRDEYIKTTRNSKPVWKGSWRYMKPARARRKLVTLNHRNY